MGQAGSVSGLVFCGYESDRVGYGFFSVKACQVKSVSGLVLTESGSGRVWDLLKPGQVGFRTVKSGPNCFLTGSDRVEFGTARFFYLIEKRPNPKI